MTVRSLPAVLAVALAGPAAAAEPQRAAPSPPRGTGDYERLDIGERRITAGPYEASLALVREERGLRVRVGVMLTAARIHVLLRNVKGSYLFRVDDVRPGGDTPPQP